MTDPTRVLQVLIHDLRTPIGVAQGYVRLLQDQKLESPQERARALARAMDALGHLSRLCAEAAGFLDTGSVAMAIPASELAARVEARLGSHGAEVDRASIAADARIRVGCDAERLADAIAVVLGTIGDANQKLAPTVHIESRMSLLHFLAAPDGCGLAAVAGDAKQPFDPWRGRGLGVPLAHHLITAAHGQVWSLTSAVLVAIPLETSTA